MIGRSLLVSTLSVLGACAGAAAPDDGSPTQPSGIAPVGDTTGAETSSSTSRDGGESTDAVLDDDAGVPASTDTGSTGDAEEGSTTTASDVGGICIASAADSPCTACSKTSCCTQLMACSSDPGCTCFMTCVATSADVFGCGTQCAVNLFAPGPAGDLVSCSSGPCAAACL